MRTIVLLLLVYTVVVLDYHAGEYLARPRLLTYYLRVREMCIPRRDEGAIRRRPDAIQRERIRTRTFYCCV